jgi:hypothetical protein
VSTNVAFGVLVTVGVLVLVGVGKGDLVLDGVIGGVFVGVDVPVAV